MSDAVKGVVETSLNVGVVTMNEHEAEIVCLIRSLIDSGKDYVASMLTAIGELAGAKTSPSGGYPGWQPIQRHRSWHWYGKPTKTVQQNA